MRPIGKLRIAVMATALALSCGTADAQRWHHRPYRVVTVVAKPDVTVHVGNRFSQRERFRIAMAYLKNHKYLTVKRYAKMTELSRAAAKAELDSFVANKDKPITTAVRGKKIVYVMRNRK
ncbi:hypothetical protein [Parabacteroides merdae]|uniref:hypothetical protein n=1 Tax=Parabacteroides merdae TaxID=46503 RepID=UPI0034A22AD3